MQIESLFGGANAVSTHAQAPVRAEEPQTQQPATSAADQTSADENAGLSGRLVLQSSFVEKLILHAKADASLALFSDRSETAPASATVATSYAEF
mgnify:CR=1 FL=1